MKSFARRTGIGASDEQGRDGGELGVHGCRGAAACGCKRALRGQLLCRMRRKPSEGADAICELFVFLDLVPIIRI